MALLVLVRTPWWRKPFTLLDGCVDQPGDSLGGDDAVLDGKVKY